jgi:hypothetical protein
MVTRPEGGTECVLNETVASRLLILRPRGEIVGPHNGGESREEDAQRSEPGQNRPDAITVRARPGEGREPTMNVSLLKKIKTHILAEPDAFRMDTWSCGTAHCIGGWALVLNGLKIANPDEDACYQALEDGRNPDVVAARLLDLSADVADDSLDDRTERSRLFLSDHWPDRFIDAYEDAQSCAEKAQIAAERIDHFIATNGAE